MTSKITPFLWFDTQAEDAAKYYTSIFRNSKLGQVSRYPEGTPGKPGSVMTVEFQIEGQDFIALNGGPDFKFTEATSFVVHCDNQKELDHYWDRLTADGGKPVQCGWLKDKYGLSWQIVPAAMGRLASGDPAKVGRVMAAVMKMVKLDIAALERAAQGG
jgi:predicted 3-demethylubiquinone-9 3-methyltransferase (glyoxalase superfamily)